ncbi:MAG TPA: sugar phosphate nucleotidyltransferase [Chitinophagaceae bacterium]|nr:sugar phosphate nucleotidyltransferase [Chitinophagaceae bacterium]
MKKTDATSREMGAMIFAAGLGTRFKPWTDKHPTALAIVNGKPLLLHAIQYLQKYGIRKVVVNVHHFANQIIDAIKKNNGWGSEIIISNEEDEVLETGGGLLKARKLLQSQRFITVNVDILTDLNIEKFFDHHQQTGAFISLAIAERKTSRFLLFNEHNRLCGWRNIRGDEIIEKITMPASSYIQKAYSGMAIFEPGIFDHITMTGKFSVIDIYLQLAQSKIISGYDHTGDKWVDVGRPESVLMAEKLFS